MPFNAVAALLLSCNWSACCIAFCCFLFLLCFARASACALLVRLFVRSFFISISGVSLTVKLILAAALPLPLLLLSAFDQSINTNSRAQWALPHWFAFELILINGNAARRKWTDRSDPLLLHKKWTQLQLFLSVRCPKVGHKLRASLYPPSLPLSL